MQTLSRGRKSLQQNGKIPDKKYMTSIFVLFDILAQGRIPVAQDHQGQSCRTGTMHFLKGELEVLALDVFL